MTDVGCAPRFEARQTGPEERPISNDLESRGPKVQAAVHGIAVDVLRFDQDPLPDGTDEKQPQRTNDSESHQCEFAPVRQRQPDNDRCQGEIAPSRKAEGGDDHADDEECQTPDPFESMCVKSEAARHCDDRDDIQRDCVGSRVDNDRRRFRDVVRVPHQSDEDHDRIGEPGDGGAGSEAGEHDNSAPRGADHVDEDQGEHHRFQQVGSIQAQGRG